MDGLLIWRFVFDEISFLECGPSGLVFIFVLTPNQTWKSVCRLGNNANASCSQCHLISTRGLWFYFWADQEETMQAVAQAAVMEGTHESYVPENYLLVRWCGAIISLLQCAKQDWTMWWMLHPHGVTAACRVSEPVPALQQISANFCRGGEKMRLWDLSM